MTPKKGDVMKTKFEVIREKWAFKLSQDKDYPPFAKIYKKFIEDLDSLICKQGMQTNKICDFTGEPCSNYPLCGWKVIK